MTDPDIERAVRRAVGIATLRRLRKLVDAEAAQEASAARWARRLARGFVLAALLAVVWLAFR